MEAAVAAYREMLRAELGGEHFNKAENNREVQALTGRSKGSVEFKHQNISAVLNQFGLPYIEGYKPRVNFQSLLEDVVAEVIAPDAEIQALAEMVVDRSEFETPEPESSIRWWVEAPKPEKEGIYRGVGEHPSRARTVIGKNYLEIESRNRSLGLAGEEFVMEVEHRRLWEAGLKRLADRIEHVSRTKGDGLGYDIVSYDENGQERLIEVKTTQFGILTPFFATRNEVAVSADEAERYQLYRVFSFRKKPRLFALKGPLGRTCQLEPSVYEALPRS